MRYLVLCMCIIYNSLDRHQYICDCVLHFSVSSSQLLHCCRHSGVTTVANYSAVNAYSALTLLVGHQEEHPACKN